MKKIILSLVGLVLILVFGLMGIVGAAGTTLYVDDDDATCGGNSPCYSTIQAAINAANNGDTIEVAAGTYTETLNLGNKELSIIGASINTVTIDASSFTNTYAIHNFGNDTIIKNLKLIGVLSGNSAYGFKVSHVDNILLENIKVDSSYKTGVDLHTVTKIHNGVLEL
jgi:pectin methylesterase-like acyl-CoA thioesterase